MSTLKADQLDLAELLMNSLLGRQVDNSYIVRMYSIRGLGNMADIEGNQVTSVMNHSLYFYNIKMHS